MAKLHPEIDDKLRAFVERQHLFFVATAPAGGEGHVNCSPKGLDSFRILGPRSVAYIDYYGSGVETIAHLRENGRIVVMFCAFDGAPKILRFWGRGVVHEPHEDGFAELLPRFVPAAIPRAIIRIDVERIADSCGFGVPLYAYEGERTQLPASSEKKGEAGYAAYREGKNARSIDGLPALGVV
ncbi:MAG: pyridoxamine 5'-phosphate oxidase family protein [Acidobacteria bacterium]|nr:pyridoxamine 5'-phosphate oxidase family protein [Acidobacteriota bacterium]